MSELLVPFEYTYMLRAMWVSALVGGLCAFLSAYLMLKGWSLMGDALSHAVVPGVAIAYLLQLPYASGAFFSGIIAAFGMWGIRQVTRLKEDAVIGVVFTAFFALGLFIVSIRPVSIDVQSIVLGNILGITDEDAMQVVVVAIVAFAILLVTWKDLMLVFFDEHHAKAVGLNTTFLKVLFFSLLSASAVAALQTVGVVLVVATLKVRRSPSPQAADQLPAMFTIQETPNRSVNIPKVSPHGAFSSGTTIDPPADSPSQKRRS